MSREEEEKEQARQLEKMREVLRPKPYGSEGQKEEEPFFDEDDELSVESCYEVEKSEIHPIEDEVEVTAARGPAVKRGLTLTPRGSPQKVSKPKEGPQELKEVKLT